MADGKTPIGISRIMQALPDLAGLPQAVPSVLVCVTIALATTFLSYHYGGRTLLYAQLLGMAFHFLSE